MPVAVTLRGTGHVHVLHGAAQVRDVGDTGVDDGHRHAVAVEAVVRAVARALSAIAAHPTASRLRCRRRSSGGPRRSRRPPAAATCWAPRPRRRPRWTTAPRRKHRQRAAESSGWSDRRRCRRPTTRAAAPSASPRGGLAAPDDALTGSTRATARVATATARHDRADGRVRAASDEGMPRLSLRYVPLVIDIPQTPPGEPNG